MKGVDPATILDDRSVARAQRRGDYVSLRELGPTPVDEMAVARMRERVNRPKKPQKESKK